MPFEFLEKFGSRPGLERISRLLDAWGNPQGKMKVVLVSGTNGKGSTVAFLSSILRAQGRKAGSFYSPHLLRFNERIRVGGEEIADSEVERLESEVKKWVESGGEITYFEAVAACAYRYFEETGVEYAVMETGMGGRLDAVNAADEVVGIVTSVGLEHTKWLGTEISRIAYEKAGVLKKGIAITGAGEGRETIRSEARKRGLNLLVLGEDFDAVVRRRGVDGSRFDYSGRMRLDGLEIGLLGDFQVRNASLAVCAAEGLGCSAGAIRAGLGAARIRGRMEVLAYEPLVVADVAHNPQGIKALADALGIFGDRKIACVFSCMKDKDWKEMLRVLGEKVDTFIVCRPGGNERAEEPGEILGEAKKHAVAHAAGSVGDAIERAGKIAGADGMVLITGSIYMMEEAYGALQEHFAAGEPGTAREKKKRKRE